ncbi:MAG: EAL domain-containing protein [Cloacibacillus sp.]
MKTYSKRQLNLRLVFLLIAITAGLWFYNSFLKDRLTEQNKQYLLEISAKNAAAIESLVKEELDTIKAVVNIIQNAPDFSVANTMTTLNLEAERKTFKRLGLVESDGNTITTDAVTMNLLDRDYYKKALKGESNVSDRLVDKIGGELINVFAVPLYVSNDIKGVVIATVDNKKFSDLLRVDIFSGEGFAYVIKTDGKPVIYPRHKNSLSEFDDLFQAMLSGGVSEQDVLRIKKDMSEGKSGMIEYRRDGVARIAAYCASSVNDWYVFSVVPKAVALHTTDSILFASFILTLLIAVSSLGFLMFSMNTQKKHVDVIERIAFVDELTGASTLAKFKMDVQRSLEEHPDTSYIMSKLDIAGFKLINDQFGFETGDMVIKSLASAIQSLKKYDDETFARVNSDEFVIFCRFFSMEAHEAMRRQCVEHFGRLTENFEFNIKLPTGRYLITSFNDVKDDSVSVFEKVNFAHRKAKESSAENIVVYNDEIKTSIFKEKEIESKMEAALRNHEFKLYLQPKYRLSDETISGAEALSRWKPSSTALIYPCTFIPVFEKNGFITKLDMYMLEQTCIQIKTWLEKGIKPPVVSVNFSRLHLRNERFVDELCEICDRHHVAHTFIEVEITESTMMENEELLYGVLDRLHEKGFTVSMDDFGTGYSSLGLLRNIPIDVIKIDRSFFLPAHDNERAKAVLLNVLNLARDLKIYTVAEGVEEKTHIDMLRELGCDMVQGYYYAMPVPAEDLYK